MVWAPSQRFFSITLAILFTWSGAYIAAMAWLIPEQVERFAGPVLGCLVSALAWGIMRRGHLELAVKVLVVGVWLIVTGVAVLNGGLRSPVMIAYPPIIFLVGWIFGPRLTAIVAGLTVAVVVALALAEAWNLLPALPATPPALLGLFQVLVFSLSTVLIVFLVRVYQSRQDALTVASAALAPAHARPGDQYSQPGDRDRGSPDGVLGIRFRAGHHPL